MASIICPIIRYDVLSMYNCPFSGDLERYNEYEPEYEGMEDSRYGDLEEYVLTFGENDITYDNNMSRCDIYKNIGPTRRKSFTLQEAERIGKMLGIDWKTSKFDAEQFRTGLDVELEHGRRDMLTNVTNDDPILTGKIALAHLNEFPDYYIRLAKMEKEALEHFRIE